MNRHVFSEFNIKHYFLTDEKIEAIKCTSTQLVV